GRACQLSVCVVVIRLRSFRRPFHFADPTGPISQRPRVTAELGEYGFRAEMATARTFPASMLLEQFGDHPLDPGVTFPPVELKTARARAPRRRSPGRAGCCRRGC